MGAFIGLLGVVGLFIAFFIGALILLAGLIFLIVYLCIRRKKQKKGNKADRFANRDFAARFSCHESDAADTVF